MTRSMRMLVAISVGTLTPLCTKAQVTDFGTVDDGSFVLWMHTQPGEFNAWLERTAQSEIRLRAMSALDGKPSWVFSLLIDENMAMASGLDTSSDQRHLIQRLADVTCRIQRSAILNELRAFDLPQERRDDALRKYTQRRRLLMSHADQLLAAILDAKQGERLRQLKWWRGGLSVFVEDPEIPRLLRMTVPQRIELYIRYVESRSVKENPPPELVSISTSFDPQRDPKGVRRARAAQDIHLLEQQADAYVWAVLTRRQRQTWRELLGAPPAIPWLWSNWSDLLDLGPAPSLRRPADHDAHEKPEEPKRGGIDPDVEVANQLASRTFQALAKASVTERLALTQEQQGAIRDLASVTRDILQRLEQQNEPVRRAVRVARSRKIINHAEALAYGLLSEDQTALLRSASW